MKLTDLDIRYFIRRTNSIYGQHYCIIYGSLIEAKIGLNVEVNDIDVMVFDNDKSKYRYDSAIKYEINWVTLDDIIHEIYNEPKMLLCESTLNIEPYFDKSKVRSSVSNVCSKAYNKGKKKLITESDYDEYLGLKNLYHAMKFPYFAKWKFINNNTYPPEDIEYLNDIRSKIFSTYKSSTGTLDERFEAVNSWLKPEFNKTMTEFRINFPKVK